MNKLSFSGREAGPAKINLSLEVLERRPDHYHNIKSLMLTVDLEDQLSLFLRSDDRASWRVTTDQTDLPRDEDNIAYMAARAFFDWYQIEPDHYSLDLKIEKKIPSGAGLGGGSADAAATLRLLERAFFPDNNFEAMPPAYMARKIGADVPYCYRGGTQFVGGIGDVMTELEAFPKLPLILVKPPFTVSTKEAYASLNRGQILPEKTDPSIFMKTYREILSRESYFQFNDILKNSFFPYVLKLYPEIEELLAVLRQSGSFFVSLSGSGPTIFALYENNRDLSASAARMRETFPEFLVYETTIL